MTEGSALGGGPPRGRVSKISGPLFDSRSSRVSRGPGRARRYASAPCSAGCAPGTPGSPALRACMIFANVPAVTNMNAL